MGKNNKCSAPKKVQEASADKKKEAQKNKGKPPGGNNPISKGAVTVKDAPKKG
jgi:hypothetical protein